MKIIEINPSVKKLVDANGGYCPCAAKQIPHTKCICDNFRNQLIVGPCNCGRYEKVLEQSDIECLLSTLESKLEDEPGRGRLTIPRPLIVNFSCRAADGHETDERKQSPARWLRRNGEGSGDTHQTGAGVAGGEST